MANPSSGQHLLFLVALPLLATAGCSQKQSNQPATTSPAPSSPSAENPAEPPPGPATLPTPRPPVLSAEGLGDWDGNEPLTADRARTLFPTLRIAEDKVEIMGDELDAIIAYSNGDKLFSTFDGRTITIHSPKVEVKGGLVVGADASVAKDVLGKLTCYGGVEDYGEMILCDGAAWPGLRVVIDTGVSTYYDKRVPAKKLDDLLAGKTVMELVWQTN